MSEQGRTGEPYKVMTQLDVNGEPAASALPGVKANVAAPSAIEKSSR